MLSFVLKATKSLEIWTKPPGVCLTQFSMFSLSGTVNFFICHQIKKQSIKGKGDYLCDEHKH